MLPTTEAIRSLLSNTVKQPQLILEVDGLPLITSSKSYNYAYYGQTGLYYGDDNLVYGGLAEDESSLPYIDLGKSTNNITQQLLIDKGGFSSTTNFDISIVDSNQIITEMITPNKYVNDLLGKKAKIYLSLDGAGHPQDSVLFFSGIVSDIKAGAGYINLNISSPEKIKNSEIFPIITTEIKYDISAFNDTIELNDVSMIISSSDNSLETYIKINDEIIKFTGITGNIITGCVRGQFDTIPSSHTAGSGADGFYRLKGNLKDLSLKIMLSDGGESYLSGVNVLSINSYGTLSYANSVFIPLTNLSEKYGVSVGDIVNISGSSVPANNGNANIIEFSENIYGTHIILNKTLISEGAGSVLSFKSKYNVLPRFAGLGLNPDQVDIKEFEDVYSQNSSRFFEYDFYIKDQVNGSEFINEKILYPSGCFSLPRKAKISLGVMTPPLAKSGTVKLNNDSVVNAGSIKINRSISKHFYNSVAFRYDIDAVEDKFLKNKIYVSENSVNRIKLPYKPRIIEAEGVRNYSNLDNVFNSQAERFLNRYQYGAEFLDVQVPFGIGFPIEIGDTVILDGTELNISDTKDFNGTRDFFPRLFEVQNKSMSMKGTPVTLTLVDTAYSLSGRYGTISPSSRVNVSLSTPGRLKLVQSQSEVENSESPSLKWSNYVGEFITVHDKEWSWSETVMIDSIDSADDGAIFITPNLTNALSGNIVVDIKNYPENSDKVDNAFNKALHCFFNKTYALSNNCTSSQIEIDPLDAMMFPAGSTILIHNKDYTQKEKAKIESLSLSSVGPSYALLSLPLSFTPDENFNAQLVTYLDYGAPYLWL